MMNSLVSIIKSLLQLCADRTCHVGCRQIFLILSHSWVLSIRWEITGKMRESAPKLKNMSSRQCTSDHDEPNAQREITSPSESRAGFERHHPGHNKTLLSCIQLVPCLESFLESFCKIPRQTCPDEEGTRVSPRRLIASALF